MPSTTLAPPTSLTDPLVAIFIAIPLALAALFVYGVWLAWRRSTGSGQAAGGAAVVAFLSVAVWMAATDMLARSGVLRQWVAVPPPLPLLAGAIVAVAAGVAFSPLGRRLMVLPLWALVAVQAFRFPLELAMHYAYERGVMPVQMSYSGRNFDIVTGITAIIVAALIRAGRGGSALVMLWNVLGTILLVNIVVVAILSTPLFAYFGDQQLNVWITYPPFVWLPAMMVLAALMGHLLIFRLFTNTIRSDSARRPQ